MIGKCKRRTYGYKNCRIIIAVLVSSTETNIWVKNPVKQKWTTTEPAAATVWSYNTHCFISLFTTIILILT